MSSDSPLPRLLIVDDSRIVRATVRKHLADVYDVIEEGDGEAGWRRLQQDETIQLLISDLSMPELDGIGLLDRLRACSDARLKQLPVIIVSGEEDEATREKCVAHGANDFITKSTDRSEMLARVHANIELAERQRELDAARLQQAQTATHDNTGAGSPHLLSLQAEQALAYAHRHDTEVSLLLLQLDRFDTLAGHVGQRLADQLLGVFTKHLTAKLRREDTLAHIDAGRFAVLSPGTTLDQAKVLAERLCQTVAAARVNFRGEQLSLTASLAVANTLHDECSTADALFETATARLDATPDENRIMLPPRRAPSTLALADAISLLAHGNQSDVRAHLPALLVQIAPLLRFASDELGTGALLEAIYGAQAATETV
ncbi:response regulator [Jeongeupia wiesaeckerbachi]|uniref:GGDEF domain-containing response regulator n=1 Tax=Jeongeupia wiesaeckerbachi TaxID=3051218 RepID=UPI003D8016D2